MECREILAGSVCWNWEYSALVIDCTTKNFIKNYNFEGNPYLFSETHTFFSQCLWGIAWGRTNVRRIRWLVSTSHWRLSSGGKKYLCLRCRFSFSRWMRLSWPVDEHWEEDAEIHYNILHPVLFIPAKVTVPLSFVGCTVSQWDDHDTVHAIWSYVINVAKMIFPFKTITWRKARGRGAGEADESIRVQGHDFQSDEQIHKHSFIHSLTRSFSQSLCPSVTHSVTRKQ